jgi:signal peptidase
MSKFLRLLIFNILAALVLVSAAGLALWQSQGLRFYSVQTGSMSPALQPGDLAITTKPDINNLRAGDIISYKSSQNPSKIITHRIYQISQPKGYIVTKGDNLRYPDPPIALSSVTGKAAMAAPKLGQVLNWLHKPLGLIGLIYLPALLITGYELARLMTFFSQRTYGLQGGAGSQKPLI